MQLWAQSGARNSDSACASVSAPVCRPNQPCRPSAAVGAAAHVVAASESVPNGTPHERDALSPPAPTMSVALRVSDACQLCPPSVIAADAATTGRACQYLIAAPYTVYHYCRTGSIRRHCTDISVPQRSSAIRRSRAQRHQRREKHCRTNSLLDGAAQLVPREAHARAGAELEYRHIRSRFVQAGGRNLRARGRCRVPHGHT